MNLRGVVLILALASLAALAQQRAAGPVESGANLPAEPIGPSDLIAVSVYGAPELTLTIRVSEDGLVRMPMLKRKIEARGLTPAELEARIARALAEEEILVEPVVTVTIAEYHSRPVSVAGAVKMPLTFQASGKTTLLEALTRAQGLNDDAGAEILITRTGREGGNPLVERIPVKGLIESADPALNVTLAGGEEVRVLPAGRVFVVGNVKKPGAFRMEAGMTVLKALAMAEGLAPYATREAYIYRRGDAASQEVPQEVPIALRKILDRRAPDVALSANDIFYVPDNRAGRATAAAIEKALGFAIGTASGALILSAHD
jgi:polysaccharide export outer membrane protein